MEYLPPSIREDAKQYVFEELLNRERKSPGWLADLHERGSLRHYVARMVFNIRYNPKHAFHKHYGLQSGIDSTDELLSRGRTPYAFTSDEAYELAAMDCSERVEALYWYYAELLKLRSECKSDRELARQIGLPRSTVQDGLNKGRELIKKMMRISPNE